MFLTLFTNFLFNILSTAQGSDRPRKHDNLKVLTCQSIGPSLLCVSSQHNINQIFAFIIPVSLLESKSPSIPAAAYVLYPEEKFDSTKILHPMSMSSSLEGLSTNSSFILDECFYKCQHFDNCFYGCKERRKVLARDNMNEPDPFYLNITEGANDDDNMYNWKLPRDMDIALQDANGQIGLLSYRENSAPDGISTIRSSKKWKRLMSATTQRNRIPYVINHLLILTIFSSYKKRHYQLNPLIGDRMEQEI